MNPCRSISQEFQLPDDFLSVFKSYIAITQGGQDKRVTQSQVNIFATNIHSQQMNAQKNIYNDFDIAFAVGMVFKILVTQKIELLDYFCTYQQNMNEKQKYAFELLKFTTYQLDKRDPQLYLNTLLANKHIPYQLLQGEVNLSKIYSFVYLCDLGSFFKQFSNGQIFKFVFWQGSNKINLKQVTNEIDLYFYQPSASFPIIILQQYDEVQLMYKIFEEHQIFMTHISIQLILDAVSGKLSTTSENLKSQPYKFESLQSLGGVLFAGQPNWQEKVEKFAKIQNIGNTLGFLINPQATFELVKKSLEESQEQDVQQQQMQAQGANKTSFDPFATQIPTESQAVNNLRKTISY
ncbi:unnamed protein product [Paramecium sonneborni]|uniref:Uncharacterized protein n=2 Tax=Paramecium sonneborni TaxID=65129 RepID=A0A8S1PH88_9CILI|nr:unnamed protein product [Paramecium sonneborni]